MGFTGKTTAMTWTAKGRFAFCNPGNVNGIEELKPISLDVFPNPSVGGHVSLSWPGSESVADVAVFDLTGRQVAGLTQVVRNERVHLDLAFWHLHRQNADGDVFFNDTISGRSLSSTFYENQICWRVVLRWGESTPPVWSMAFGSKSTIHVSLSATGRCSTPRGTTIMLLHEPLRCGRESAWSFHL